MLRLRALREDGEETQSELGKILGVAPGTISNWENEARQMDYDMLFKAAQHYHVSIDYLLGNDFDIKSLTKDEQEILKLYRSANSETKKKVWKILRAMVDD